MFKKTKYRIDRFKLLSHHDKLEIKKVPFCESQNKKKKLSCAFSDIANRNVDLDLDFIDLEARSFFRNFLVSEVPAVQFSTVFMKTFSLVFNANLLKK